MSESTPIRDLLQCNAVASAAVDWTSDCRDIGVNHPRTKRAEDRLRALILADVTPDPDPIREWTPEQIADLVQRARDRQYAIANSLQALTAAQYPGQHPEPDEALQRGRISIAAGKLAALVGGGR